MKAKLTLKLITEAYYKQAKFFTACSWMIVIVWSDCFTYLMLTKKVFCIRSSLMRTQFGRMGRAMARCHIFLSFSCF